MTKEVLFNTTGLQEGGIYRSSVDIQAQMSFPEHMMRDFASGLVDTVGTAAVKLKDRLNADEWETIPLEEATDRIVHYMQNKATASTFPVSRSTEQSSLAASAGGGSLEEQDAPPPTEDDFVQFEEDLGSELDLPKEDESKTTDSDPTMFKRSVSSFADDEDLKQSSISETIETTDVSTTASDHLPFATSDIRQPVALRMGTKGFAALPALTVMQCFDTTVKRHGNRRALFQKVRHLWYRPGQNDQTVQFNHTMLPPFSRSHTHTYIQHKPVSFSTYSIPPLSAARIRATTRPTLVGKAGRGRNTPSMSTHSPRR